MTPDEPPELEYHRIELHRLAAQVQSLRSALVVSSNCIADLLMLVDENHPEQRERARTRVAEAIGEIDRHLSGASFGSPGQGESG